MKLGHLRFVAIVAISCAFAWAQPPSNGSSNALTFENGTVANGVYSNECFGFSLPIPAGWEVNDAFTAGGKARHRSDKSLILLFLHQQGKPGGIILSTWDSAGHTGSAQDFVSDAVRAQINSPTEKRELVRDTFAVDYGGRHFFRSDYKALTRDNIPLYLAYVYTEFRGYFIGETLASASPAGLDEDASSLQRISFQEDQVNSKCVMNPDDAAPPLLRIEQGVSRGLLIKRVSPDYPPIARQARVQGQVVLRAQIDKNGNIEDLTLVSGHPMLAPAAIKAVKQWKYKPYTVNGQAVAVETQIVVNFSLSGGFYGVRWRTDECVRRYVVRYS
ncbi:MAG TPA: energy transducer TonB [Terriglobales bacterium]|nr:energy transducer TonB [Terriglobales bacterium]